MKLKPLVKRKGQIWIETVIYTLIGLALIGLVLAFIMPKLNQSKDKALVEQSINSLNTIDSTINKVLDQGPGNTGWPVSLTLNRGSFYVNGTGNSLSMVLTGLSGTYSQPGVTVKVGRVNVRTEQGQKTNTVYLTVNYTNIANITYNGKDIDKKFTAAPTPYKLTISNLGNPSGGLPEIRFTTS